MASRLSRLESISNVIEAGFFQQASATEVATDRPKGTDVFIVHGRDEAARDSVARLVEQLELKTIILAEQADVSLTVIEKFEDFAARAGAAIVLLTPDDVGGLKGSGAEGLQPRARQNVIFELGFFAAHLGRGRVIALKKGKVEIPSDVRGVIFTELDEGGGWRLRLADSLNAMGLPVDPHKLLSQR